MTLRTDSNFEDSYDSALWREELQVRLFSMEGGSVRAYGAKGDGVADDTGAFRRCLADVIKKGVNLIHVPAGNYRITDTITIGESVKRGAITFVGDGAQWGANDSSISGTKLIWDAAASVTTMFDIGGDPLFIGGVAQIDSNATFNVQFKHLSMDIKSLCYPLIDVHSGDSFRLEDVFFNALTDDARGIVDLHGTVGNVSFDNITCGNVKGYFCRCYDGAGNFDFSKTYIIKGGLGYWIGDAPDNYQNAFGVDNITLDNGTCEGIEGVGKWEVTTLSATSSAGTNSVTVTTATGYAVGDPVHIGRGYQNFEMNRVTAVNGSVLTLAYDLEFAHASGEIIKAGSSLVHVGKPGASFGRSTNIILRRQMIDRSGCLLDAHSASNIKVEQPFISTSTIRGLFLDGDVLHTVIDNPRVSNGQLSTWKFLEITNRGGVFGIASSILKEDSGVSDPWLNSQGAVHGVSYTPEIPANTPANWRYFAANDTEGIILGETTGAVGLSYRTGEGSTSISFSCTPSGNGEFANGLTLGTDLTFTTEGEPAAPSTGQSILFTETFSGKNHLYIKFATGAKQLLATEP